MEQLRTHAQKIADRTDELMRAEPKGAIEPAPLVEEPGGHGPGDPEDVESLRSRHRPLRPMPGATLPESGKPTEKHHGEESRMSIVAIAHRGDRRGPEDFALRLDAESTHVMELYAKEKIRDILQSFR